MNKYKNSKIVIILLLSFYSCTKEIIKNTEDVLRKEWECFIVADNTPNTFFKEVNYHELAKSLLYENCIIINGRIEIDSKQEWIKNGFPEALYERTKQNIHSINERNDILDKRDDLLFSFSKEKVLDDFRKNQEAFFAQKRYFPDESEH